MEINHDVQSTKMSWTNHVDSHVGRGIHKMSTFQIKLSMKGKWVGQKSPKNGPHGLCMIPKLNSYFGFRIKYLNACTIVRLRDKSIYWYFVDPLIWKMEFIDAYQNLYIWKNLIGDILYVKRTSFSACIVVVMQH